VGGRWLTRAIRDASALHVTPFNTHQPSAALDGLVPQRPASP
jgi:hypothetical protein